MTWWPIGRITRFKSRKPVRSRSRILIISKAQAPPVDWYRPTYQNTKTILNLEGNRCLTIMWKWKIRTPLVRILPRVGPIRILQILTSRRWWLIFNTLLVNFSRSGTYTFSVIRHVRQWLSTYRAICACCVPVKASCACNRKAWFCRRQCLYKTLKAAQDNYIGRIISKSSINIKMIWC